MLFISPHSPDAGDRGTMLPLGEELGWSGYAIDPMQDRWNALQAAILLGLVWAVWHIVPLAQGGRSPSWIAWWGLGTVASRVLIVRLYNNRLIDVEGMEATQTSLAPGDIAMELTATVRNSTGRTINELEMRGVIFNEKREPLGERTVRVISKQQAPLKPNETMKARILVEGVPPKAQRKEINMEVTGLRFE